MRKRKKASVQADFRYKRDRSDGLYSISVLDSTVEDLYYFIVLGIKTKTLNNLRRELIRKNRHPARQDKYKKKWQDRVWP